MIAYLIELAMISPGHPLWDEWVVVAVFGYCCCAFGFGFTCGAVYERRAAKDEKQEWRLP